MSIKINTSQNSSFGVDVVTTSDLSVHPHCPHGPTLLFERFHLDKNDERTIQKFFACSACRDRKDCSFFQHYDEKVSKTRLELREQKNKQLQPHFSHTEMYKRLLDVRDLPREKRQLCLTCGVWISEDEDLHLSHSKKENISDEMLREPSSLMMPLESNKANAQFLFSKESTDVIIDHLEKMKYTHVICLGTVRLHEQLTLKRYKNPNYPLKSILLDIDHRYGSFYNQDEYCRYNMMNNYFFENETAEAKFKSFIEEPGAVVFTDPPFGGMIDVLSLTIKKMMELHAEKKNDTGSPLPVYWIFPYFMEQRILQNLQGMVMLDYKVDYDNHKKFQNKECKKKRGSPVRIFTNITPKSFDLTDQDNYHYCDICEIFVAGENKHCSKCGSCTTKDGKSYKHCDKCERCVKPSRIHCEKCNRCEFQDHQCGVTKSTGCHICGDTTHKRRECPNIEQNRGKRQKKVKGFQGRKKKKLK